MMLRVLSIAASALATWALWIGFQRLDVLQGTVLWDFRYIIFVAAAFLGLSIMEWAIRKLDERLKSK